MRLVGLLAVAAAALAAVQIAAPKVRAQAGENPPSVAAPPSVPEAPEVVIDIGPDNGPGVEERGDRRLRRRPRPGVGAGAVAVSRYWIGIGGEPLPDELRAQVDIDSEEGVLIRTVAPESPAAAAGVRQFDILLRANGKSVGDIGELADLVGEQGERKGKITLDLLRRGRIKTLWVEPIERPIDASPNAPRRRFGGRFGLRPEGLGGPNRGRLFGPDGGISLEDLLGQAESMLEGQAMQGLDGLGDLVPQIAGSGVSVSVRRDGAGPAKVTVQQGGKSWEFDEGDQDAIGALPDDVRPMVERMLQRNGGVLQPGFEGFQLDVPGFELNLQGDGVAERIRAMQERMQALREGLRVDPGTLNDEAAPPAIELDEAPAFDSTPDSESEPEEAGPIEIEIPVEDTPAEG